MNTYFYLQVILVVIFILYIMYKYPYIFYPNELAEGFTNSNNKKKKNEYTLEESIKFDSDKKFNDKRYIYLYNDFQGKEKSIFQQNKLDLDFVKFYNNKKNNRNKTFFKFDSEFEGNISGPIEVEEIIIGRDNNVGIEKFYYTADNNIHGVFKKNKKIYYRYYEALENFKEEMIHKFVGKERSSSFFKLFNIKKNNEKFLEGENSYILKMYESDSLDKKREIIKAYYFFTKPLNLKIGFQKDKLKKLLKDYNCNIEGFDNWCQQKDKKNKIINWVAISRKSAKPTITIYYRD